MAIADGYFFTETLLHVDGLPVDSFVNTFAATWFGGSPPANADFAAASEDVQAFYTALATGQTTRIGASISREVSRASGAMHFKAYSIPPSPAPFGSPLYSDERSMWPAAGTDLPAEIAAVTSFHADLTDVPIEVGTTRPAARRMGRIYVGPLTNTAVGTVDNVVRLVSAYVTDLAAATKGLQASLEADNWQLGVFSRMDWALRDVVGGFVENACDVQRKRGPRASSRTLWTA